MLKKAMQKTGKLRRNKVNESELPRHLLDRAVLYDATHEDRKPRKNIASRTGT